MQEERATDSSKRKLDSRTVALATALGVALSCGALVRSHAERTDARKETTVKNEAVRHIALLSFMVGDWDLDYTVHQGGKIQNDLCGTGSIKPIFDGVYLWFEYEIRNKQRGEISGEARGIFAWDSKAEAYRYYWFENSGAFLNATAHLRDEHTLFILWHGVDCTQTFRRKSDDAMLLEMTCPEQDLVLQVNMSRREDASGNAIESLQRRD
jgi:hypothetical protein